MTRALRVAGWTFIGVGVVILLYLVYSLLFTGVETRRAQAELREQWELNVGDVKLPIAQQQLLAGEPERVDPGEAMAVLQFARPGVAERPVQDGPLFVVEGTRVEDLKKGPGHYIRTAMPGQPGNFAVAGHRTTYGSPFFDLDDLRPGDVVYVTDRQGTRWRYSVVRQEIVAPTALYVVDPDPLGTGRPMLTFTTCHPRFSSAQRLVVYAQLVGSEGTA